MNPASAPLRRQLAIAFSIALATAVLGGLATDIGPWYYALRKPPWQPPDWLFAPVWTMIYGLSATACVIAWRAASAPSRRRLLVLLFALNIALNTLWSLLFFRLKRPDQALAEVVLLWLSVLSLVLATMPLARTSGLLLLPYLAWVSFASLLNFSIVQLNAPFVSP